MKKTVSSKPPLIGAHFSIAGGVEQAILSAVRLRCGVAQLFTKNARQWNASPIPDENIAAFIKLQKETGIITASHTSYLINLAAKDKSKRAKALDAFTDELVRAGQLQLPYMVTHPGSAPDGDIQSAIKRIADGVDESIERSGNAHTMVLIEVTAGGGNAVGGRFEHLRDIIDASSNKPRLGLCFDTCHVFSAGYDLRTKQTYAETMDTFGRIVGTRHIRFFHLNDSKSELGSHRDRHEHIGKGFIGKAAFGYILNDKRFASIGRCIETPKGDDDSWDKKNILLLKRLIHQQ